MIISDAKNKFILGIRKKNFFELKFVLHLAIRLNRSAPLMHTADAHWCCCALDFLQLLELRMFFFFKSWPPHKYGSDYDGADPAYDGGVFGRTLLKTPSKPRKATNAES